MMYKLYIFNDEDIICTFKFKQKNMEEVYNKYGKNLVESGLKTGYSISIQTLKYKKFINEINKRKRHCNKIRKSDLHLYLNIYSALWKFNQIEDNCFFLKQINRRKF